MTTVIVLILGCQTIAILALAVAVVYLTRTVRAQTRQLVTVSAWFRELTDATSDALDALRSRVRMDVRRRPDGEGR